jgi:L-threonylcarbamoyladenylate synthase
MDFTLLNALSNLEKPEGLIAIPGPEHYVLAVRPDHPQALARLHRVKGNTEPLLLLGWDLDAFTPYIEPLHPKARQLIQQYWPGPLVLMVQRSHDLPHTFSQQGHVKIMQPNNQTLRDFLALNPGGLLATLCASRASDPPARTATAVYNSFGDDVDFVIEDDEALEENVAPTVISVEADGTVHLLRNGGIVLD